MTFPHSVDDGLFDDDLIDAAAGEFPSPDDLRWRRSNNPRERKFGGGPDCWGPATKALLQQMSARSDIAEQVVGLDGLQPDTIGGGMHMIVTGGTLHVHVDFNTHPVTRWFRYANMLLFLNRNWNPGWGGQLLLTEPDGTPFQTIVPEANRLVTFACTPTSYHGHPDTLACPPDRARKSLAVYWYSPVPPDGYEGRRHTRFLPEPA